MTLGSTMAGYVEAGFAGVKFKVGGRTPAEDAAARARRPRGARARPRAHGRRQPGLRPGAGGRVRAAGRRPRHPLVRGAVPLDQRPALDARRALPDRHRRSAPARARRRSAAIRDLIVDGAIDVSNFDASWAGGPTIWRKAAGLAAAFGVQLGHHEEPQVSSHLLASVPDHTFVECFDEERDPFFWNLSDLSTWIARRPLRSARTAGLRHRARLGLRRPPHRRPPGHDPLTGSAVTPPGRPCRRAGRR